MAVVIFYEKPGCQGNQRQKLLLVAAGHTVLARDLKGEKWTADRLLAFLGALPVSQWFNRNAPQLKSGEIVPENLLADEALYLLRENPLLIRRPLLAVDGAAGIERRVGFNAAEIDAWIGLKGGDDAVGCAGDSCAHASVDHLPEKGSHGCCGAH